MSKKIFFTIFCFLIVLTNIGQSKSSCAQSDIQFLTTFHPHMDAFWLNTDTELKDINFRPAGFLYNMNQRNSKTILNSMLQALTQSVERKFFITQIVFFKDWYDYLTPEKKKQTQELLLNGQLQIANAGWVENDEAVCYLDDILDQYTIGHEFLYSNFGIQVKVGWSTDSFGHSASQAALLHLLGIQFQGIQRIDDRYVNEHKDGGLLQFYWIPVSDSNNRTYGGLLNHIRHFLHEVNNLRSTSPKSVEKDYESLEKRIQELYHKKKMFRFLGNDFEEFISTEFSTLQSAIKQMNTYSQSNNECPAYRYGNPSDYLNIIAQYYETQSLPSRKHDFIPNWDQDRFWAGYYTTDPSIKKHCKDFSRLVNLYRKIIQIEKVPYNQASSILIPAQELLAVLQHHDGITATSKTYIEDQFRRRIDKSRSQLTEHIKKIYEVKETISIVCELYKQNNVCVLKNEYFSTSPEELTLSIITQGNAKVQKIQLHNLPDNIFLEVVNNQYEIFCEQKPASKCRIVFEAALLPGINQFKLVKRRLDQVQDKLFAMELIQGLGNLKYSGADFSINVSEIDNEITYQFNEEFMKFGFYTSPNQGGNRQTKSWDKYGRKTESSQHIMPGMYIMFNNGKLQKLGQSFGSMKVSEGSKHRIIIFKTNVITLQLIAKKDQPNLIDITFSFKPPTRSTTDYFLKVSSLIKSTTLYHDSNGFLVKKRIQNWRPDYVYDFKPEDIINGNNYPATSFAYLLNNDKKLLFSSDRAQGVSAYDGSLLINFDRLAFDDGKGVGQSYMKVVENKFHYKFAIISANDDLERIWQRYYDEALIGTIMPSTEHLKSSSIINVDNLNHYTTEKYLKYSIYHLNKDQIVLRLMNLAQFEQQKLLKYTKKQEGGKFQITSLGIKLQYKDIVESYANGIPKQQNKNGKWRKHWGNDTEEINVSNQGKSDSEEFIILRPLEIRSFRINFNNKIKVKENSQQSGNIIQQKMTEIKKSHAKLRKRCF